MEVEETKERGITMIALVITITVLLILAGISVSQFINDDGVIKGAGNLLNRKNTEEGELQKELADLTNETFNSLGEDTLSQNSKLIENIIIEPQNVEIKEGETTTLTVSVEPEYFSTKNLECKSTTEGVIQIMEKGDRTITIKGTKAGTTQIVINAQDGSSKSAQCTVNVSSI